MECKNVENNTQKIIRALINLNLEVFLNDFAFPASAQSLSSGKLEGKRRCISSFRTDRSPGGKFRRGGFLILLPRELM